MAVRVLRIRSANRDIFEAIKKGKKKIETRAATKRYRLIKAGDMIVFVCGKSKFQKKVRSVEIFRSVGAILKKYKPVQINPNTKTEKEARAIWNSFSGYSDKIRRYGLIAFKVRD
jgi:ASC-1-like (ASCH) protein